MNEGDKVRLRALYSTDEWCVCIIELLSSSKVSAGLRVLDGALRTKGGGILTAFIPVLFTDLSAHEMITGTELEFEIWRPA